MTVAEIFTQLADHMLRGLMLHESWANLYEYLGLRGYSRFHEKQYREESKTYRELNRYYIQRYGTLIPNVSPDTKFASIPKEFYSMRSDSLSQKTIRNSVKMELEEWVKWESDTKRLYEHMYTELVALSEIAAAMRLSKIICDVDEELAEATSYLLTKQAVDYDISNIIDEQ